MKTAIRHPDRCLPFVVAALALAVLFASVGCKGAESGTPPPAPASGSHTPDLKSDEK